MTPAGLAKVVASLPDFDFAALSQRAETQLLELETLRREAAAQALRS